MACVCASKCEGGALPACKEGLSKLWCPVQWFTGSTLMHGKSLQVLVQHRVTEAVDGVREFGEHRRIEMDVGIAGKMDVRGDLACELLEDEVLVLRLGAEPGSLEDTLAVPLSVGDQMRGAVCGDVRRRQRRHVDARQDPFLCRRRVTVIKDLLD